MKNFSVRFFGLFSVLLMLGACESVQTDPTYSDKSREELYKHGSLASEAGGVSLFGGGEEKKKESTGLAVNGYLWRASLDTLSFMPLASADPFGGVITTDWHSTPEAPDERVKLNVFILDRELRADGLKVTVFRQIRENGEWKDAPVAAATGSSLEDAILTRARQLKLAQKERP